jgi:pSer/pThr/pTyr-binding forkhead associated (FHA) protein
MSKPNDSLPEGAPSGKPCLILATPGRKQPPFVLDQLCVVVGTGESADLQLAWEAAPRPHALIVTTREGVYLRDLTDDASVSVNGKDVREQFLSDGDKLEIGKFSLAFAANQAVFKPHSPIGNASVELDEKKSIALSGRTALIGRRADCDIRLRDNQVSVPHAVIFHADQNWHIRDLDSESGTFIDEEKIRDGIIGNGQCVQIGSHQMRLVSASGPSEADPIQPTQAAAAPAVGTIPRFKRPRANVHDNGDAPIPSAEILAEHADAAEIEDFSENQFWEMTDDQAGDVPLPPRPTDLTPAIPPAGTTADTEGTADAPTVADPLGGLPHAWDEGADVFAQAPPPMEWQEGDEDSEPSEFAERTRPARSTSARPTSSRPTSPQPGAGGGKLVAQPSLQPTKAWQPRRRRSMRQIGRMVGGMVLSMSAAAALIWFVLPQHSIVEGRVLFENTPAAGSAAWQTFETQQRTRLADPSTSAAAIELLGKEYSDLKPEYLADIAKTAAIAQNASFAKLDGDNRYDLVVRINESDPTSGTARVSELLKAFYQSDNDLTSAAAQARQALTDWQSSMAAKQQELDDLNSKISEQKKRIADAQTAAGQLKGLQDAADQAEKNYAAAQTTLDKDQAELQKLSNELSLDSVTPAATQPSKDPIYADIEAQIRELNGRIDAAKATGVDKAEPAALQSLIAAEKQLDREFASALDLLKNYPDTVFSLTTARQLNDRISQLNDELIERQSDSIDRYVKRRLFVERAAHRRQQAVYTGDDQIQQLRAQLADATRRLDEAEQANPAMAAEDRKGMELEIRSLRSQLSARQVALNIDEDPTLHERLGRLIDDAKTQLRSDRQAIEDTIGTLTAQLQATPPMPDLTTAQKGSLDHVIQGVQDLIQAEAAFTAASSQAGPAAQAILERQDQVADLKEQADLRQQILAAPPAATQEKRIDLANQRDAIAGRLSDDQKAVLAAHDGFMSNAMAGVDAALSVQAGRVAGQNIETLESNRDAKSSEIDDLRQQEAGLQHAADTTLYVKQPVQSDVSVVWDDSLRKTIFTFLAMTAIGGFFAWKINGSGQRSETGTAGPKATNSNPASPAVVS